MVFASADDMFFKRHVGWRVAFFWRVIIPIAMTIIILSGDSILIECTKGFLSLKLEKSVRFDIEINVHYHALDMTLTDHQHHSYFWDLTWPTAPYAGGVGLSEGDETPNPASAWLGDKSWDEMRRLSSLDNFSGCAAEFASMVSTVAWCHDCKSWSELDGSWVKAFEWVLSRTFQMNNYANDLRTQGICRTSI